MKRGDMVRVNTSRVVRKFHDSTWTDLYDDDMCWRKTGVLSRGEIGVVLDMAWFNGFIRVRVLKSSGETGWCHQSGLEVVP